MMRFSLNLKCNTCGQRWSNEVQSEEQDAHLHAVNVLAKVLSEHPHDDTGDWTLSWKPPARKSE